MKNADIQGFHGTEKFSLCQKTLFIGLAFFTP